VRAVLLIALGLVAITVGALFVQDKLRGGDTPGDVAESYVAAASAGDTSRVLRLMPSEREDPSAARAHADRLRGINSEAVLIDYVPNQTASYIVTARISYRGVSVDEVVLQKFGRRWYLVHFPE